MLWIWKAGKLEGKEKKEKKGEETFGRKSGAVRDHATTTEGIFGKMPKLSYALKGFVGSL
jgi:hypothetical protein